MSTQAPAGFTLVAPSTIDAPSTVSAPGSLWDGAEIISIYTRTDAINDGALIDVSDVTGPEFGINWPVAFTAAAHGDVIAWGGPGQRTGLCQDETGRMADAMLYVRQLLPALCASAQQDGDASRAFKVLRVPGHGRGMKARLADLVVHLTLGDLGTPVLTVMHPGES